MIKTIAYHSAECDKCGKKIDSEPYMYKKEFIQMLRRYGWSIGKRCVCYECRGEHYETNCGADMREGQDDS